MRLPHPLPGPLRVSLPAAFALLVTAAAPARASDTLATVAGRVVDLAVDGGGALVYCTKERDVGTISTSGVVSLLANAATGPFPNQLRAVALDPTGDVAVIDQYGDIYRLVGGATPAMKVYSNLYLVQDPTDMIVDAAGNYVIAGATPTSGVRGMNWVSGDGSRWAYYLRRHAPVQLAADPLTGHLLLAEEEAGGGLWTIDTAAGPHPTTALDTTTDPGFTAAADDGDMAAEADGDVLFIAGGAVYHHDRGLGTTTIIAGGYGQLRGIAIAASSGNVASASGWSAYVAEGEAPTSIREIGNVGAPAALLAPSLGWVPGPGYHKLFYNGIKVYDLAADRDGNLLVGGDLWGVTYSVRRIDIPTFAMTTIADETDGISGRVEGIAVDPDGTIYALTHQGVIHAIRENPLQVSTVFDNAGGVIGTGKDLVLGRNGKLYVADSEFWGSGEVVEVTIATGTATAIVHTRETRGLAADPFRGGLTVAEWVAGGFEGEVGRLDLSTGTITPLPGFAGMNYSNAQTWGDGDTVAMANGNLFTISEDDWSLSKYTAEWQDFARVGSGFLNHPSGLTVAPSAPSASNTTGWSLYIAEFDNLWEFKNTVPPAPVVVDPAAPPVGAMLGYMNPADGRPRAMIADPAGGGLLVTTSDGKLLGMNAGSGVVSTLAGASQGLAGDLVAAAATSLGTIVVGTRDGVVFALAPAAGYAATVLFDNASLTLADVRGACVDGLDRVLLVDRPAGVTGGRVWRLDGGNLTLLTRTARGLRPAIDPLTGDAFVTEQGAIAEGAGEVLRVDAFTSPASAGHFRGDTYFTFPLGELGGDLAFDDDGDFYVAGDEDGRIVRVNRAVGTRTVVAGNYTRPVAVALAPGRPAYAGAQGTSLFVLDEWVVWETGVDDLPAPAPPSTPPGLAPPADLRLFGNAGLGQANAVAAVRPAEAGKLYWILASQGGKVPGVPLSVMGDPTDPRVLPGNIDDLWFMAGNPAIFPFFLSFLDGGGHTAPGTALLVPNDPAILGLEMFLDLTWVVVDRTAPNKVAHVGGTTQIYLGQ